MFKAAFAGFLAVFVFSMLVRLFWSWRESRRFWQEWEVRRRQIDLELAVAFVLAAEEIRERQRREDSEWTPSQN